MKTKTKAPRKLKGKATGLARKSATLKAKKPKKATAAAVQRIAPIEPKPAVALPVERWGQSINPFLMLPTLLFSMMSMWLKGIDRSFATDGAVRARR